MIKEEKVELLQGKGAAMIAWFEGKLLPAAPLKLKPWATITDTNKYFSTQIDRMHARKDDPYSVLYVNAYIALRDLRAHMET